MNKKGIIFCATQRSGSTMVLSDMRQVLGKKNAGSFESEGLYREGVAKKADCWESAYNSVKDRRLDDDLGFFYDKVMYHYVSKISKLIDKETHDSINTPFYNFFPPKDYHWIYIVRANTAEQAVSKYIAETQNIWSAQHIKSEDQLINIELNVDECMIHYVYLLKEHKEWLHFFSSHKLEPITLYYEEIVNRFPEYMKTLLKNLEIDFDDNIDLSSSRDMKKVGGKKNMEFAEIIRAEAIKRNIDI